MVKEEKKEIVLQDYNSKAYDEIKELFKEQSMVAFIQASGTVKTLVGLQLIKEYLAENDNNGKKSGEVKKNRTALYVTATKQALYDIKDNIIEHDDTKNFKGLKRITYKKLNQLAKKGLLEKFASNFGCIVLDNYEKCSEKITEENVKKLIESSKENVKVLGMSARNNKADKIFGDNIVNGLSLEDIIKEGLVSCEYTGALYGGSEELTKDVEKALDKLKDEETKELLTRSYNSLKQKLDENVKNMPEMFEDIIKNKDGKYLVFCKSIEDMKEKMEQAKSIFGKVNENIVIGGVSSENKEEDNRKEIVAFRKDKEENRLRLLFSVDMLNEGVHFKDIDGAILMRPTSSESVFENQMGRVLSVYGKNVQIIDSVNNYISGKNYPGFREIVEPNSNDENDKEEKGERSFENYTITSEMIDIYSVLENIKSESFKESEIRKQLEEIEKKRKEQEQEKLDQSLLDIDEKELEKQIAKLRDFKKRYYIIEERAKMHEDEEVRSTLREKYVYNYIGKEKVESEENKNIKVDIYLKPYEDLNQYYSNIVALKENGRLSKEQEKLIEEEMLEDYYGKEPRAGGISEKYGISMEDSKYLISKYGSLDEYYRIYKDGKLDDRKDIELSDKIITKTIDLDDRFDNLNYNELYEKINEDKINENNELTVFSSKKLKESISKYVGEDNRKILSEYYGLNSRHKKSKEEIEKENNLGKAGVELKVDSIVRKIRDSKKEDLYYGEKTAPDYDIDIKKNYNDGTEEQKKQIDEYIKKLQLREGNREYNLIKLEEINNEIAMEKEKQQQEEAEKKIVEVEKAEEKIEIRRKNKYDKNIERKRRVFSGYVMLNRKKAEMKNTLEEEKKENAKVEDIKLEITNENGDLKEKLYYDMNREELIELLKKKDKTIEDQKKEIERIEEDRELYG